MNARYKSIILAISVFFGLSISVSAAPGDLDLTFGSGGFVRTSITYYQPGSEEMLVQPDGKIVVCGWNLDGDGNGASFFLARFHATGALDASFGTNGKIIGPYLSGALVGSGIALQPDGKIIAVGPVFFAGGGFGVHRYNANGTLDASFGTGGVVITPGQYSSAESVAVQADGKIVVVGYGYQPSANYDLTVVRLQQDGSLDTSFNGTGIVTTSFGNGSYASKVVLQPDGKIVAVGGAGTGINGSASALVRYNADGSLDSGFGVGGKVIHAVSFSSGFADAVLQPDGKIVASGYFTESNNYYPYRTAIVRYNTNGSIDTSFAANGIFTTDANFYVGNGIALQSDGKLVTFGSAVDSAGIGVGFVVARLNPNGTWDTGFGNSGRVTTPIDTNSDSRTTDGAVQPDGKILVFGATYGNIAIVRYLGDSAACSNPIDCPDFFVRQQYLDFLGREPDPLGAQWISMLSGCAVDDTSCDRIHVSEAFFKSDEFGNRGYFVWRFYPISFPNVPGVDPPGAGHKPEVYEFSPDLARVSGFLTPAELEAAKVQFAVDFTQRAAFVARYGSLSNAEFVNTLCSTAGVTLSNQQMLIDSLSNGATRAQVLRQIVESPEVYNRYYNEAFVVMQYFGYLRRNPDALYLDWIDVLNANPADSRHMIEGFVNSIEYRQRFGP